MTERANTLWKLRQLRKAKRFALSLNCLGDGVAFHTAFTAPAEFSFQQLRGEYPIDVWHDSEEPVLVCMK